MKRKHRRSTAFAPGTEASRFWAGGVDALRLESAPWTRWGLNSTITTDVLLPAALALVGAACLSVSNDAESSIDGSVTIDQSVESDPFYNPIIEQAMVDARLLSSKPLGGLEAPVPIWTRTAPLRASGNSETSRLVSGRQTMAHTLASAASDT